MVQEAKEERYRGVLCNFCRQPIPLPAIVAKAEFERTEKSKDDELDGMEKSFHIRCRACEKEASYGTSEIVDVPGVPRMRAFRARTISGITRTGAELAKAANG